MSLNDKPAKVYNALESCSASGFIQSLFYLHTEFEKTRNSLQTGSNYYVSAIFSLFGYHYKGRVDSPSILHISAQAWLLGVIGELKKEIKQEDIPSQTYFDLLKQIKSSIVEENIFIENMKLLIGIYETNESVFGDNRIFKIFLVNIQDTKNQINIEENEKDKITRLDFYNILLRNLRTAFNSTLNEFNTNEREKSLDMLNSYLDELAKVSPHSPSFETFTNTYFTKKGIADSLPQQEEKKIILSLQIFFNFCEISFEDLLTEIDLFNKNASSIIFKIKQLVSVKNIQRMYFKYLQLLCDAFQKGVKNLRLEGLINFYMLVKDRINLIAYHSVVIKLNEKYSRTKTWLDSTVQSYKVIYTPKLKEYYFYFQNLQNQASKIYNYKYIFTPINTFNDYILKPSSKLLVEVRNKIITCSLLVRDLSIENFNLVRQLIIEKASELLNCTKNKLSSLNILNFDYKNNYLVITIEKSFLLYAPKKAMDLVKNISHLIINFDPLLTACTLCSNLKEKANTIKKDLVVRYRNFLALADEPEVSSQPCSIKN